MNEERYIAAVEISSSKIIATVARTRGNGQLDVLAVEQVKAVECVRYGIIQNLEETSMRLSRILQRLEQHPAIAPRKISGVYVGISGRSLHSITTEVSLSLPDDTEITDEIIKRLKDQAMTKAIDNTLEVVDAVPGMYRIGKQETMSPKGVIGNNIRATFELIVCRPELIKNLTRTIPDKLGVKIEGIFVTALSTGHLILSADEKRLGCMLVDMGAETTTVSIYRNGTLNYFATLPMGGRNITRDLTSLNILEERAEEMKISTGNAMANPIAANINIEGIRTMDVNNLIVARSEEIVANIIEQIEYLGIKESDLPGGIVCIGGASSLNGIMELLSQQSNLPTQLGKLPPYVRISDSKAGTQSCLEVISIAYSGATFGNADCLITPQPEQLPESGTELPEELPEVTVKKEKKTGPGWFNRLKGKAVEFFNAPPDNNDLYDDGDQQ